MKSAPKNSIIKRLMRAIHLFVHIATGSAIVLIKFPKLSDTQKAFLVHEWSKKLMSILALHIIIKGEQPKELQPKNFLLVCNHISWLDIFAISTNVIPYFIAKKELQDWPIIGNVIKNAGTLFINRENKRDSSKINQQMENKLREGACMAIFPESTTSNGSSLLPFKSSLFKSALAAQSTIQPLAIRYFDKFGYFSDLPAYAGETTFIRSIWRILSMPSGIIEISFCQQIVLSSLNKDISRADLSKIIYERIKECFAT